MIDVFCKRCFINKVAMVNFTIPLDGTMLCPTVHKEISITDISKMSKVKICLTNLLKI